MVPDPMAIAENFNVELRDMRAVAAAGGDAGGGSRRKPAEEEAVET